MAEKKQKDNFEMYVEKELELAGLFDEDSDYNGMIGKDIMQIITIFSKQEHSGCSAELIISILERLIRWIPLTPLTDNPSEWNRVEYATRPDELLWQSTRQPDAFSLDNGKTYYALNETENKGKFRERIYHKSKPWTKK